MLRTLLANQFRFLFFRPIRPDTANRFWQQALFLLTIAWLVGVGRYWDPPNADWWQYAGLGSVGYVLFLSLFLYIVIAPLKPNNWSLKTVMLFVGFTALPGLLYAVPVERFMSLENAQLTNAIFLGIVALWRVALYAKLLWSAAKLPWYAVLVALLLPLSAIVFALSILNMEHVVFQIMAGIQDSGDTQQSGPNDGAYIVVLVLTMGASIALPFTIIGYVTAIVLAHSQPKQL